MLFWFLAIHSDILDIPLLNTEFESYFTVTFYWETFFFHVSESVFALILMPLIHLHCSQELNFQNSVTQMPSFTFLFKPHE
jgi:hypothetical protein